MNYTIDCCDKMKEELDTENLFKVLDVIPFTKISQKPTAHIITDQGHGGIEEINFCPFCGKKITIVK